MRRIARLLCITLFVAITSCSGSSVPVVRDYTSSNPTHSVHPQSVIGKCPIGQQCGACGDSGCPQSVYTIHCPAAESCTTSTPYTVGQPVSCVTGTGAFTTGCGGPPGQGSGIAVFWGPDGTCYQDLATTDYNCFAASNASRPYSTSNLTIKYCWYSAQNQTQHYFTVPASPSGSTTLETYKDTNGVIGLGFEPILASYTQYGVAWGGSNGISLGSLGAIPSSTSNIDVIANGSLSPLSAPHYSGYASAVNTSQNCLGPYPNG